jgi:hypothetical protein
MRGIFHFIKSLVMGKSFLGVLKGSILGELIRETRKNNLLVKND